MVHIPAAGMGLFWLLIFPQPPLAPGCLALAAELLVKAALEAWLGEEVSTGIWGHLRVTLPFI